MTVFLEAVHTVKPLTNSAFDRWVQFYDEVVIPAMQRNGFDVVGAWKRAGGAMGQDVVLSRFQSLADVETAMASLGRDRELFAGIQPLLEELDIDESVKVTNPVPYATERRLEAALAAKPDSPRQYMQAILRVKLGGQMKAYELVGKLADWGEDVGALQLVTAYETAIGQRGELTDLWVLPNGLPSLDYRAGDPLAELIGPLREVAPEESIHYLNPLPYSPLQ